MHKSVPAASEDRPYGFDRKVRAGEIFRGGSEVIIQFPDCSGQSENLWK